MFVPDARRLIVHFCCGILVYFAIIVTPSGGSQLQTFEATISVGNAAVATTNIESLTSVTMDICLAKQRFPFDDPTFLALTKHLGGGSSILRVGGSDQNSFFYAVDSSENEPFSRETGGKCCANQGSCHGCVKDCTMPAPYWKSIVNAANFTGHKLMFGLVPEPLNATSLITFSARQRLPILAYTYGNEENKESVIAGYPILKKVLQEEFPYGENAPLLAGPDVALQRHSSIEDAIAGNDVTVNKDLVWVDNFTSAIGEDLDVVSWHT